MSADGGVHWVGVGGCANNVSSFTRTGLTNGHSYDFRVSAQNANGMSAPSAPVTVVPSNSPSKGKTTQKIIKNCELFLLGHRFQIPRNQQRVVHFNKTWF
jgi:hypothetical protein